MTCEGKEDLNSLTQAELEQAHRFHAWRAFLPAQESVITEEIIQRKKDDVDSIDKIHREYMKRFGSKAVIKLVRSINELNERGIL